MPYRTGAFSIIVEMLIYSKSQYPCFNMDQ